MPRKSSVLSISLPPDLASNLDSTARKEHRSRSELVREAVRQYVLLARWRSLREKAALKAVEQGLNLKPRGQALTRDRKMKEIAIVERHGKP